MYSNLLNEAAWTLSGLSPDSAQFELTGYLDSPVNAIAPELKPIVPAKIRVERVGLTRNASNTPYIVYWVRDRRCCTFVKRKVFLQLVQVLLKLTKGVEDKIRSVTSSLDFGLWVKAGDCCHYIPSAYVRKFFDMYNAVAVEPSACLWECSCDQLYGFCVHTIFSLSSYSPVAFEKIQQEFLGGFSNPRQVRAPAEHVNA